MSNGFVVGGVLTLQKTASLSGAKVHMPEGSMTYGARGLSCVHYCDIHPGMSLGEDFHFLHVEDDTERPIEAAVQAIRDFRMRPAGNGECYSIAHHEDFAELLIATSAASARSRRDVVKPITDVTKICFLNMGGQMFYDGVKHNALMVRESKGVHVRGIMKGSGIRRGMYIPVTTHKVGIWK